MKTLHLVIITIIGIITGGIVLHNAYAPCAVGIVCGDLRPDPLFLTDDKGRIDNFLTNHQILIRYDAWARTPDSKSMNLEINFTSDSGSILDDKENLPLELGKPTSIIWKFIPTKAGKYTIEKFSNGTHTSTTYFTVIDADKSTNQTVLVSPLLQFKFGVAAENVQCSQNFVLLLRPSDNNPACVKSEDVSHFMTRGWTQAPSGGVPQLLEQIEQSSGNTKSPASFEPCNTPFPQSSTGVPVLYIPMNFIGKLCVRYSNFNDFPASLGIKISNADNLTHEATEISTWNDAGGNTTLPKGNFTIVYWIKTGNQAGFYGLTIFCAPTAFAVGYDNGSRIVSGDFPWFGKQFECPMLTYDYHIDSTSGIGVKYIPYP